MSAKTHAGFKSTADALINESVNDLDDFYQTFL